MLSFCACSASACNGEHYDYMTLTKIVAINDETDYSNPDFDYNLCITSLATDGNIWQWYSDDTSWQVGDSVILHMVDVRDTFSDKTDDKVCCVSFVEQ